jgi:hypothetical protein
VLTTPIAVFTMADLAVHDRPIYAFTITDLAVHDGPTRAIKSSATPNHLHPFIGSYAINVWPIAH